MSDTPIHDGLLEEYERRRSPRLLDQFKEWTGVPVHPAWSPAQIVLAILLAGVVLALLLILAVGMIL
jgi:hypothetical protein